MKQVPIPNATNSQKGIVSNLADAVLALTALTPSPSDGTTSHSTRLSNNASQVAGYPACGESVARGAKPEFLPRFEQLINGLVFELFFPDDLHRANIRLFDACEKAGIAKLATFKGKALTDAANDLATCIFANDHPIYGMLFDLQGLDVVRIVEGRE
ncbi:MAG: hypothetical protein EPO42_08180 [Gallionellaceae bacterium]|nr:MAG: hypothetical protein EPO42_08180 [Gallionellaceae bacterium]